MKVRTHGAIKRKSTTTEKKLAPIVELSRQGRNGKPLKGSLMLNPKYNQKRTAKSTGLVLTGVGPRTPITIAPADYNLLTVDRNYQRDPVASEVNELISALDAGGVIPDPISIVERTWDKDDLHFYVVDGLQRASAFMNRGMTFEADLYKVDNYESERSFFIALNSRVGVSRDHVVHSWSGPGADMLRGVDVLPDHPLMGRVKFGRGQEKIGAMMLIKGMMAASFGAKQFGSTISWLLGRLDHSFASDPQTKAKCSAYLRIVGGVFPLGRRSYLLPIVALGVVVGKRWNAGTFVMPTEGVVKKISHANWPVLARGGWSMRFCSVFEEEIERIWRL